jgi:hypothetical protein
MLHAQKLHDLVALDAFKQAQLNPTASERAHLHNTRALCPNLSWLVMDA